MIVNFSITPLVVALLFLGVIPVGNPLLKTGNSQPKTGKKPPFLTARRSKLTARSSQLNKPAFTQSSPITKPCHPERRPSRPLRMSHFMTALASSGAGPYSIDSYFSMMSPGMFALALVLMSRQPSYSYMQTINRRIGSGWQASIWLEKTNHVPDHGHYR
jgi:hypothetical protein